jgi:hypothetical protein
VAFSKQQNARRDHDDGFQKGKKKSRKQKRKQDPRAKAHGRDSHKLSQTYPTHTRTSFDGLISSRSYYMQIFSNRASPKANIRPLFFIY